MTRTTPLPPGTEVSSAFSSRNWTIPTPSRTVSRVSAKLMLTTAGRERWREGGREGRREGGRGREGGREECVEMCMRFLQF